MFLKYFSCLLLFSACQGFSQSSTVEKEAPSCTSSDLPNPFIKAPTPSEQKNIEELTSKELPTRQAEALYLKALLAICQNNNDLAITLLQKSYTLDSSLVIAKVQLAYLYLWEQRWDESYEDFKQALAKCPCEKRLFPGLEALAHHFEMTKATRDKALNIYRMLIKCNPDQVDYLFYLGRLLSWMGKWNEAEEVLKETLKLAPNNSDAGIQLGYLYLWEGRLLEAKEQFEKFSSRQEAQKGLKRIENRVQTLPSPFTTPPGSLNQKKIEEDIALRCGEEESADCLYLEGLLALCLGENKKAKKLLIEALNQDDTLFEAALQIGYMNLWEDRFKKAEKAFSKALDIKPCDPEALEGLEEIAHHLEQDKVTWPEALNTYRRLLACDPTQTERLFYLGKLLAWMGKWNEAEEVLKECLRLSPDNSDAGVQLGYLYLWQGRLEEARAVFNEFIDRPEAKVGLAKIAEREGNYELAKQWYEKAKEEGANRSEMDKGIARSLANMYQYTQAADEYQELIEQFPYDNVLRQEFFEVRSRVKPSYSVDTIFIRAKEDDPNLGRPVVLNYYLETNATVHIPIFDRWSVDVVGFFGYQKETSAIPPIRLNYDTRSAGPRIKSRYLFAKDWRFDAFFTIRSTWGIGDGLYPFKSATKFEPGTALLYHSNTQLFALSGVVSSFIIKDFSDFFATAAETPTEVSDGGLPIPTIPSQLLSLVTAEGIYGYTFPVLMNPEIEGQARHAWYNDPISNTRMDEDLWLRCGAPYIEKNLTFFYHCFHSHFSKLTPNYFSYQEQVINTVGSRLHLDIKERSYVELGYEHSWWWTKKLVQPIGNTIFITPLQVLTANRYEGLFGVRAKEFLRFEVKGHYYRNTLPYRDWGLRGNLSWLF